MTGADPLTAADRDRAPRRDLPDWLTPALAVLTEERFSDPGWIFERKLDGERALARIGGDGVRLLSRNRKELNDSYPELVEALGQQAPCGAIVDGEIVAFEGHLTSFSRLQKRMQIRDPDAALASGVAVFFYLFDILYVDGHDLRPLPLRRRKALLKAAIAFEDPVRFTPHRNASGEAFFEEACARGWEGLIAKRAEACYPAGRNRDWLKVKCAHGQELVIGGFTEPQGGRTDFGALLVGYFDGDAFRYAGKVGTGFDAETLANLHDLMQEIARDDPPFADPPDEEGITWIAPELVAEIGFAEWTEAGRLRHPRYLGLRRDKPATDVVREAGR